MPRKYYVPDIGKVIEIQHSAPRMDSRFYPAVATGETRARRPTAIINGKEVSVGSPWRYLGEGEDAWRFDYWEEDDGV